MGNYESAVQTESMKLRDADYLVVMFRVVSEMLEVRS